MTNPGDTATVSITGNHTFSGTNLNAVNNRITIANIIFVNSSATVPTFTLTATVASQINIFGCFLQNNNAATTAQIIRVGSLVNCYLTNVVSRMSSVAGSGGTHFVNAGGNLYCWSGVDVDGGTRVLDATAVSYSQLTNSQLVCTSASGGEVIRVVAGAVVGAGYCSITNNATTGNGVNLLGLNSALYAAWCTFNILNSATTYVITGGAGSVYLYSANHYANVPALLTRNVKIKNTVTAVAYTTTLTSSP
jgi:hypothetical protein